MEARALLPTCEAAEFASLAYCQHLHQRRAAEAGIEGTPSSQKLLCVPVWFPSCSSADQFTPFASVSPFLTDILFGNKLAKAVKYIEYAAQVSGGRERDYLQTGFTVYVKRLLPYNLVDCQILKQCNFPLNHEI